MKKLFVWLAGVSICAAQAVSIGPFATEGWVEEKIKEAESVTNGLASKSYVDAVSNAIPSVAGLATIEQVTAVSNLLPDVTDFATRQWVGQSITNAVDDLVVEWDSVTNKPVNVDPADGALKTNGRLKNGTYTSVNNKYSFASGEWLDVQSKGSVALGHQVSIPSSSSYTFAWSGDPSDNRYTSNGAGTFNVNPVGGTEGFYVGTNKLSDLLSGGGVSSEHDPIFKSWADDNTNSLLKTEVDPAFTNWLATTNNVWLWQEPGDSGSRFLRDSTGTNLINLNSLGYMSSVEIRDPIGDPLYVPTVYSGSSASTSGFGVYVDGSNTAQPVVLYSNGSSYSLRDNCVGYYYRPGRGEYGDLILKTRYEDIPVNRFVKCNLGGSGPYLYIADRDERYFLPTNDVSGEWVLARTNDIPYLVTTESIGALSAVDHASGNFIEWDGSGNLYTTIGYFQFLSGDYNTAYSAEAVYVDGNALVWPRDKAGVIALTNDIPSTDGLATVADATLTPAYSDTPTYSEWVCEPDTVLHGYAGEVSNLVVRHNSNYWSLEGIRTDQGTYFGVTVLPYDPIATNLVFSDPTYLSINVVATRTRTDTGYHLGSQSNKLLVSKAYVDTRQWDWSTQVTNAPAFVDKSGDTMTGGLTVPNLTVGVRATGSTVGRGSVAEGVQTTASGSCSHAEGVLTTASGLYSHAEGYQTIAQNSSEHAQGQYNVSHTGSTNAEKTIHSIGVGTGNNARTNAVEVMQDGKVFVKGVGGYDGTNPTTATNLATIVNGKMASDATGADIIAGGTGPGLTLSIADNLDDLHRFKAAVDSPTFTGTPTAPTAPAGESSELIANTEFVTRAIASHTHSSIVSGDTSVYAVNGGDAIIVNTVYTNMDGYLVSSLNGGSYLLFDTSRQEAMARLSNHDVGDTVDLGMYYCIDNTLTKCKPVTYTLISRGAGRPQACWGPIAGLNSALPQLEGLYFYLSGPDGGQLTIINSSASTVGTIGTASVSLPTGEFSTNTVAVVSDIPTDYVKTVNNTHPDANGNVNVSESDPVWTEFKDTHRIWSKTGTNIGGATITNTVVRGALAVSTQSDLGALNDLGFANGVVSIENGGIYSTVLGLNAVSSNSFAFVYSGRGDTEYADHGVGTFNVDPYGGAEGFWIGETNLATYLQNAGGGGITTESDPIFNEWTNNAVLVAGEGAMSVSGSTSTAIGSNVKTYGGSTLAVGNDIIASNQFAVAVGVYDTKAIAPYATAVGPYNTASGEASTAVGMWTTASDDHSTSVGYRVTSHGPGTFNINPTGGTAGVWIGETNLATYLAGGGGPITETDPKWTQFKNDAYINLHTNDRTQNPSYISTTVGLNVSDVGTGSSVPGSLAVGESYVSSFMSLGAGHGIISNATFGVGLGEYYRVTNSASFVWTGAGYYEGFSYSYGSHGVGTFNVDPYGGAEGFWIGETNLATYLRNVGDGVIRHESNGGVILGSADDPFYVSTYSVSEGYNTYATGVCSHAEGYLTYAGGYAAHTEGQETHAPGDYSHAEGEGSIASGPFSHAGGYYSEASGDTSFAQGYMVKASALSSVALGDHALATNEYSFVWNGPTGDYASHGVGTFNINPINGTSDVWIKGTTLAAHLDNASKLALDSIAPTFSASNVYTNGDFVLYNMHLYECTNYTGQAGWRANDWQQTTVTGILGNLRKILDAINGEAL